MDWLSAFLFRYWWVILLAIIAVVVLVGIFGTDGGSDSDPSDPCALTGSSGCM